MFMNIDMLKISIKKLLRQLGIDVKMYSIETSEAAKIQQLFKIQKTDIVIDVGANLGQYHTFIRGLGYSGRVISFEPLSQAHDQLMKISKRDPLWEIAPRIAIGNEEKEISINIAGNSKSSSLLPMLDNHKKACPESAYVGSETVKMNRLDTIITNYIDSDNHAIFLKIDVQGYEKQVLEGATNILSYVKGIQLELSLIPLYQEEALFREMLDYMEHLGYSLHSVIPGFTDTNTGQMLQMDGIFFKL